MADRSIMEDPAVRTFQEQRAIVGNPASQTVQSMYWSESARRKRGPPTPVASSLATPQEEIPAFDHTAPSLVQPWLLEDSAAAQVTAGTFGVQVQDQQAMEAWMSRPVNTTRDVFNIVRNYHKAVIRPELYHLVLQLESALTKIHNDVFKAKEELSWMASENRQLQKHAAGTQLVTSGWPNGLSPTQAGVHAGLDAPTGPQDSHFSGRKGVPVRPQRRRATPVVQCLRGGTSYGSAGQWLLERYDHAALQELRHEKCISGKIRRLGRNANLHRRPHRHPQQTCVCVSPSSPQWQRKLEAPLRVILACLNEHSEFHGKAFTILWKTLTIMAPSEERSFQPDALAWARLHYFEEHGEFKGRLEITPPLMQVLQSTPEDVEATDATLWEHCWNKVIWGAQYELDKAEREAFSKAKIEAGVGGKGIATGKGKRHWSTALIHNNYYRPYPFDITTPVVEAVAYCWDEYCTKMGRADECVGDFNVATYQGKPGGVPARVAEELDAGGDAPMGGVPTPPSQAVSSAAGAAPSSPPKGASKGKSGGKNKSTV